MVPDFEESIQLYTRIVRGKRLLPSPASVSHYLLDPKFRNRSSGGANGAWGTNAEWVISSKAKNLGESLPLWSPKE